MIISNCPRYAIEEAVRRFDLDADIEGLSKTGLRFRVKLKPSREKDITVEAGYRTFYKYKEAHRDELHRAFAQLGLDTNPADLLDITHDHEGNLLRGCDHRFSHIPEPVLLQAIHLAKGICGTKRVVHKRIAKYQRRALSNHDRACAALCWHGFRDFFITLLSLKEDAFITTGIAKYRGKEHFLLTYPKTGERQIGSNFNPMRMSEACWCEE